MTDDELKQESREELAEDRTSWAHERTLLAKERTFAAWVRTGLTAIAAGLGVARLLANVEPRWLVLLLGAILVVAGGGALILGYWSYRKTLEALEAEGVHGVPAWLLGLLTGAFALCAALALVLVFINA